MTCHRAGRSPTLLYGNDTVCKIHFPLKKLNKKMYDSHNKEEEEEEEEFICQHYTEEIK